MTRTAMGIANDPVGTNSDCRTLQSRGSTGPQAPSANALFGRDHLRWFALIDPYGRRIVTGLWPVVWNTAKCWCPVHLAVFGMLLGAKLRQASDGGRLLVADLVALGDHFGP